MSEGTVVTKMTRSSSCVHCGRYVSSGKSRLVYEGNMDGQGNFYRAVEPLGIMCPESCEPNQLEELKRMASAGSSLI